MKSTSSARKTLALVLCGTFLLPWPGGAGQAFAAELPPEPCLLVKFSAPSVPDSLARERLEGIPRLLLRDLHVRWVSLPPVVPESGGTKEPFPEADDAALEKISEMIAEALKRMERVETAEAETLLTAAERAARTFRLGSSTRPFFAEIFLRKGQLLLWQGNRSGAEEMFARSRVLRPDFSPDPSLFSPLVRDAWNRAGERPPPEADLLVHSIPPGATVFVDGKKAGSTPGRIRISPRGPVKLRMTHPGYQEAEKTGQWLPGDAESIEWVLSRDRIATLGDLLSSSPDGKGTGALLAELAGASGASRVAVVVLETREGVPVVRVLSARMGEGDPAFLGQFDWPSGDDGPAEAAGITARWLKGAGWPSTESVGGIAAKPWYTRWWVLLLVGVVAAGAAAGALGGGKSGGASSSTGTIGVSF